MEAEKFDVIIIGAGPSGLSVGLELSQAKEKLKILIIEKHTNTPKGKICGEYLCPAGVEILKDHLSAFEYEKLMGPTLPIVGHKIFPIGNNETEIIRGIFKNTEGGKSLRRKNFDKDFQEILQQRKVKIYFELTLINFTELNNSALENEKCWVLFTQTPTGEKKIFHTKMLIGADGNQSMVAQQLARPKKRNLNRMALHTYIESYNPHLERLGEMHLFKNGQYMGINPVGENLLNVSIVMDTKLLKSSNSLQLHFNELRNQSTYLQKLFPPLDSTISIKTLTPLEHYPRAIKGKNWALVGDASGFIDPLTGEGIYGAIYSGLSLGQLLRDHWDNLDFALKKYQKSHLKKFRAKKIINHIFQIVIRYELLMNLLKKFLLKKNHRPHLFIQLIGNEVTPIEFLKKIF
jgi:flavin-dependent dehydrogenase